MKRSKSVGLTFMGAVPFLLTACDQSPPPATQGIPVPAYASVEECVKAGIFTQQACENAQQAAVQAHEQTAPRFSSASECEQQYGTNNCQVVYRDGNSWFMPAMAGFMLGQALSGGRGYYGGTGYYRGEPLYRNRYDRSSWRTADNRTITRSGGVARTAPAVTKSRGGFGSRAAARGGWGS